MSTQAKAAMGYSRKLGIDGSLKRELAQAERSLDSVRYYMFLLRDAALTADPQDIEHLRRIVKRAQDTLKKAEGVTE